MTNGRSWFTLFVYYFLVDHNLPLVDHDLPWSPCHYFLPIYPMNGRSTLTNGQSWFTFHSFFSKNVVLFSIRYVLWTVARNWPCTRKVDFFHQKAVTYSRCCSRICAISLPEFHIFADMFSLTRFFHKKGVNLNFLRQNKYDKIRPIISYKRQNLVNTNTKRAQIVSQNPQKSTTRLLPTSFRTIVRRYWFRLIPPLFLVQVSLKSPTTKMGGVPIKLLLISYNFCSG